jgi:hypothetical protein
MKRCRICGKELPDWWSINTCNECFRKPAQPMALAFECPVTMPSFEKSVEEMIRPESTSAMAVNDATDFLRAIQKAQKAAKRKEYYGNRLP